MTFWTKIRAACAELSPDCQEAARAQSEALDHALPRARRFGLWLHLLMCIWCRRYGKQIRLLRDAAQAHPEELTATIPDQLSPEARERIKQRLKSEKAGG